MITLSRDDYGFLEQVEQLGGRGLSQDEIATELELTPSTLRYRLKELGFKPVRRIQLQTTLGGEWLSELVRSRRIVVEGTAEQPTAAAEARDE